MVASGKLTNFDETFVKQFLVNGSVSLPKESMLLPTGNTPKKISKVIVLQNQIQSRSEICSVP